MWLMGQSRTSSLYSSARPPHIGRIRNRGERMFISLLLGLATAVAPPAVDDTTRQLLRRADFEKATISPDGDHIAVSSHTQDGTIVSVLDRRTMETQYQVLPGKRGEVTELTWVGPKVLVVGANVADARYETALVDPALFLVTLGEKHPKPLPVRFAGLIEGNDHEVLVVSCAGYDGEGNCKTKISRVDIDHLSRDGTPVASSPIADAVMTLDHAGKVRFARAADKNARQQLLVHGDDDSWKPLNDSATSSVYVVPAGISRDNRTAYLLTEHPGAPDSIDSYDFATGTRTTLLQDKLSDPLDIIMSSDGLEPIGAWFGAGAPTARFWNDADPEVVWRKSLHASFPGEQVQVTSADTKGEHLIIRTISDRDPGSFYLIDRASGHGALLFRARPAVDPAHQMPTTSINVTARDGLLLHGFITLPAPTAELPPMVVMVHGGPFFIRDEWTYDQDTQILAQHGYAVLRINFRGSSGFGQGFMHRGYGQWGAAMQDDVTDATRWAVAQGLADGRRVCIYGGSYGGYAALMGALREPSLYRCAAGIAGVYDLNKLYSWGDIFRSNYGMTYLRTVLGTDKGQLSSRSPSDHAADITIPVLLAHGVADGRVPVDHAREMRKAMKNAGHEPQYVEYRYEGHGLAVEKDQLDFWGRLLAFLDANTAPVSSGASGTH